MYHWVLEDAKHGSEIGCRLSIFTGWLDAFRLVSCGRDKIDTDWQLLINDTKQ